MLLALALALAQSPAPAPAPSLGPSLGEGRDCRECHADIARAHDASRHGTAATNPSFTASLATSTSPTDRAWCLACHAPRASGDARAQGVGCVACHEGESHGPGRARVSERACARCHEVGLPPSQRDAAHGDVRAQDTPREHALWSRSAPSAKGCIACHLDGHRWPGGHDAAFAARALAVDAALEGGDVVVTLAVDGIGHPLPTGDPFRVLAVRLCADDACATELARARVGRALIAGAPGAALRVVDTRPWPGRPARLRLPAPEGPSFVEVALESTELLAPAEPRTRLRTIRAPARSN